MKYTILQKLLLVSVIYLLSLAPSSAGQKSIVYQKRWVAKLPVHVVTVNMNDPDVRVSPVMSRYGVGHAENWGAMIGRARPTAAVTGTFFDTRSLHPTGDIWVDGRLACRGVVGTAICFGANNEVSLIPTKRGRIKDWSAFQHVLVGGPVIVWDGKISVNPKAQGFTDSSLFARRPRTAVGVTKHGKLLMVAGARPIYLRDLARVMKGLGAVRAAAMDGGSSTALYYRGRTIVKPGRSLTNLLVAYDNSARHQEVKHLLAPATNRYVKQPESAER